MTDLHSLRALRQIHPPVTLLVGASPAICVRTLATATKPSATRLHHRELFVDGLRYYLEPTDNGFRLSCDTSALWGRRRQRTRSASFLTATFSTSKGADEPITLLRLRARMRLSAVLTALLIPAFIATIVIYMPWWPPATILLIASLFLFSSLSRRFDAAYQANEMVYFIRTVLEDLPPVHLKALPAKGPDVVLDAREVETAKPWDADFMDEFGRFYDEQVGRENS